MEHDEWPRIPPGFTSLTSFVLQRAEENHDDCAPRPILRRTDDPAERFRSLLRLKPWVNYRNFNNEEGEEEEEREVEVSQPHQRTGGSVCLPKGIIRGCSECANCQKVLARWRPEESRKPVLEEAPVFYPTEEEFKDSLDYIESIRIHAEKYGICRIIPPPSWKPSCLLKEDKIWKISQFVTRVQQIDKLQNREASPKKTVHTVADVSKRQKLLETDDVITEQNEPTFNLEMFEKYADYFKKQYFQCDHKKENISVDDVEGEYWRIIENPTESIEVLYGADLDTSSFGSGFPKLPSLTNVNNNKYIRSEWNLNNMKRLNGSVLRFETGTIPGVQVPWLYIGMCFSSFCWHVEDHHLYSLNYHHFGEPKIWYGVPGSEACKLESVMRKHLPHLFDEQPDLLHKLVTQFSPTLLKQEGVSVYKCIQQEREFVLTFPRAYHSGFNTGFNCAEAVNVAPCDWLPYGQRAIELYREQKRNITLSHDKLLLGAANEAVRAQWELYFSMGNMRSNLMWKKMVGEDGILTKMLYERNKLEQMRRECFCVVSRCKKMDEEFDEVERECVVCHFDLYLSAVGCGNCERKFACLIHAKELCECEWSSRYFVVRYSKEELSMLLEALRSKPEYVSKWSVFYLGLQGRDPES